MKPLLAALKPRERRLALVAALLVGCWVLASALVQPLWDQIQQLRLHTQMQHDRVQGLGRIVSRRGAIEREHQRLAGYLAPEADPQGGLLNALEALARQSGLHLNLKPRPIRRESGSSRVEIELDVEGAQAALLGFLDALMKMPRLLVVERLRMSTVPGKDILRMDLMLSQLLLGS